jgi:hypothetical protein
MDEPKAAEFYVSSNKFSAAGFTIAALGAAAAGLALGFAYGCVQVLMPILYVCFLVTVVFGAVLGQVVFHVVKLGQVRHRGVASAAVGVGALTGLYGAWVADRFVRLKMLHVEGIDLSFSPSELLRYMEVFLDHGFWSLLHGTPLFGFPLLLIWLAEAGIIFALALKRARKQVGETAYCEGCHRWTRTSRGVRSLMPNTSHGLTQDLKKGNLQAIHQVIPTSPGAPLSLRLDLHQCSTCADSVFLSLSVVSGGTKFREFVWPEEKPLLRHLRIAPADADALRARQKLAQIVVPGKTRPPKK